MANEIFVNNTQVRAKLIGSVWESMIQSGFELDALQYLEDEKPRAHRDFLLVFLGLKAVATHTQHVLSEYWNQKDATFGTHLWRFQSHMRTEEIHVVIEMDSGAVWNPHAVEALRSQYPGVFFPYEDHNRKKIDEEVWSERSFARVLNDLSRGGKEYMLIEAVLFGYPLIAAQEFSEYHEKMIETATTLWNKAQQASIAVQTESPTAPIHFERNPSVKTEFVRLAGMFPDIVKPELLSYVQLMRQANVPGYPYVAIEGVTNNDEAVARDLYAQTGLDQIIQATLSRE